MSATHMGKGDMFHNAGTQNICKDNGTQIIQAGPDDEAKQDRQCRNYMRQNGYDPEDQKANAQRQGGHLFEPACEWIYDNPEFQQWRDGTDPPSLWIHGGPGKGKSMLLCSVINHLLESAKGTPVDSPAASDSCLLVTYSFFSDTEGICEASFVVASLIYGLVKQQPSHLRLISKVYDHENKYPFKGKRSFTALEGILGGILESNTTGARIILVVDALDECTADLERLLHLILSTASLRNVTWLVSSRGHRVIHQEFDAIESNMRKLSLDQTREDIQKAVQAYTNHRMRRLHRLRMNEEERKELQDRLVRKAGGTFLWLSIVMAELEEGSSWHIDDVVESVDGLPEDLESLYDTLLQRLLDDLGRKRAIKKLDKDILHKTLATTAAALRPLYVEELKELAEFPVKIRDTSQVEEVIDKCGAFLTRQNDQVFLIHLSAKEFLTPDKLESAFQSCPLAIHSHLFFRSIFVMKANLKRDVYDLKEPGIDIDDIDITPSPDPLSCLRYSCIHWVDHLEQVQEKGPSHHQAIRFFIEKRVLYWLEAMSLQRKLGEAIKAMRKLHSLVNIEDDELDSIFEDVRHFVVLHRHTIEKYPLQIYISALLFSPASSWVRRLYGEEEPDWVSLKPSMETTWSTCARNLPTSEVPSELAISADGTLLAASFRSSSPRSRSSEGLVVIWDLDSHKLIRELPFDFSVTDLAFLSNGNRLALAGNRNSFEIWNAETGSRLQTLQCPDGPNIYFTSLAVSTPTHHGLNEDLIASGSNNGVIRFWDPTTGDCTRSFCTLEGPVHHLTFSTDGQKLAAMLADREIGVWYSRSGALIWKLPSYSYQGATSMAFFGDDQLATSFGPKISIWDLGTGRCVGGFAVKADAMVVSLGSSAGFACTEFSRRSVKIWNSKGDCVQALQGYHRNGHYLACCPRQQLIASSAITHINIWDLKVGRPIPLRAEWVLSIEFSSDGQLLALGSHNSIKIWNTATCTCIRSIDCTGIGGTGLTFCSSNQYLVSRQGREWRIAESSLFTIWNVENGSLVKTFDNVRRCEAFTPDGKLLALALNRSVVVIWDMNASEEKRQIERRAINLAFSADGQRLAMATYEKLEIWDMSNGECIWTVDHQKLMIDSIALSADARLLAAPIGGGGIDVWDISATALRDTIPTGGVWVQAMALSPNQELLAWANDREIEIMNMKNGKRARMQRSRGFISGIDGRATIYFKSSDSSRLCTPIGDLDTRNVCDGRVGFHGYHVDGRHEWIVRGKERVIFLPEGYRDSRAVTFSGQTIAISGLPGWILLFKFV